MAPTHNRQIVLASYPSGTPTPENFRMVHQPIPQVVAGHVLVRTLYLSVDPFPRLRMDPQATIGAPLPLGAVVIGRGVGRVIASASAEFTVGAYVAGELGWQDYALSAPAALRLVDPLMAPLRSSLSVLGPSGIAAHIALFDEAQVKPRETVLIAAAAGAVGSIAGQLASLHGCRAVGICLGREQATYLCDELGFDAAIDAHAAGDLSAAIGEVCPEGVDVFLDSVGGRTHDAGITRMNARGRVVVFGYISAYNAPAGGEPQYGNMYEVLRRRLRVSGFLVGDYASRFPAVLQQLATRLQEGRLKMREHITDGLERAPEAFAALFTNAPPGKQLVRVADETC